MTPYINELVYITLILFSIATICYFFSSRDKRIAKIAFILSVAGLITTSLALIARTILAGRLPLANGAEFALCFVWFTVFIYLLYEVKSKNKGAGGAVMLIVTLLIATIPILMPDQLGDAKPLAPALKSPWLTSHVLTAVFAYGGFALAAGLAAMQLRSSGTPQGEEWVSRIIGISFIMLTVTIVLGAIWAEQAWGKYWSWDPKEVWAMITWIIYAIYLHVHRQKFWRGRNANILAVAGFIIVLFTKYGVNFILSGLHSYS